VRNGVPVVTDGPFAEGKEVLAGYVILDCESIERATEHAIDNPSARHFAVEVQPIMHMGGSDLWRRPRASRTCCGSSRRSLAPLVNSAWHRVLTVPRTSSAEPRGRRGDGAGTSKVLRV
jgi:hypothetical protein